MLCARAASDSCDPGESHEMRFIPSHLVWIVLCFIALIDGTNKTEAIATDVNQTTNFVSEVLPFITNPPNSVRRSHADRVSVVD